MVLAHLAALCVSFIPVCYCERCAKISSVCEDLIGTSDCSSLMTPSRHNMEYEWTSRIDAGRMTSFTAEMARLAGKHRDHLEGYDYDQAKGERWVSLATTTDTRLELHS